MNALTIQPNELRQFADDVLDEHLQHYAHALVHAAAEGYHHTVHSHTFTIAVGGVALHRRTPMLTTARTAIFTYDTQDIITQQYPHVAYRNETGWHDALDDAWAAVRFKPEAVLPEDRGVFGHIELLEALRKHTATFGHSGEMIARPTV